MELCKAYREIEKRLQNIDYQSLYRGFSRFPFAVYNDTQAYIDGNDVLCRAGRMIKRSPPGYTVPESIRSRSDKDNW